MIAHSAGSMLLRPPRSETRVYHTMIGRPSSDTVSVADGI
jgi:hypothetical protein